MVKLSTVIFLAMHTKSPQNPFLQLRLRKKPYSHFFFLHTKHSIYICRLD